ncbi:TMEM165/GDT1 family protein [Salinibius halmophilus]|uniref:TMEM165/GDT1 family protein n=1 Tax=Salinibius halmophilus TaxID=1853216 RepID=UPI000E6611D3|nr:TMEM165/GDT1 family protein [Salinibius halmophilus]
MEPLITSTIAVTIAEMGDKTQLLALVLAAKFRNKLAIVSGILVATVLNHFASAAIGAFAGSALPEDWLRWVLAASFFAVALWMLIPDKDEDASGKYDQYGAFIATTLLFFFAEIGDKTQVATVLLAAEYNSIVLVSIGTTLGMLAANLPVIWAGEWLIKKIPLRLINIVAALLFAVFGTLALIS